MAKQIQNYNNGSSCDLVNKYSTFRLLRSNIPDNIYGIQLRIEQCKHTIRSNCIGTALYITGEQLKDKYVDTFTVHELYLAKLQEIQKPVQWCLVAWQHTPSYNDGKIAVPHMAVVTSTNPSFMFIANRRERNGKFVKREPFTLINRIFQDIMGSLTPTFYLPKIFE